MQPAMAFARTVFNFVVAGALFGVIIASLVMPKYLTWDNTTGTAGKALCDCADCARVSTSRFLNAQITGGGVGAGLGLVAGVAWVVLRRKKGSVTPPGAVPPAAA
jgi:hypothetical protein